MHIRHWIFLGIIILVVLYFLFEARGVIFGPSLEILQPQNGATLNSTRINIAGRTSPKTEVWVGGRILLSDENGIFSDNFVFNTGYNEIGIYVKDRFGHEAQKILKFIMK